MLATHTKSGPTMDDYEGANPRTTHPKEKHVNENTTAPSMKEANAILDDLTRYDAVSDTNRALGVLREVVDGRLDVSQERLNAISMLYQVASQREHLAINALQIAAQLQAAEKGGAGEPH